MALRQLAGIQAVNSANHQLKNREGICNSLAMSTVTANFGQRTEAYHGGLGLVREEAAVAAPRQVAGPGNLVAMISSGQIRGSPGGNSTCRAMSCGSPSIPSQVSTH